MRGRCVGDLSLDRQAFMLAPHETQVRDFYDKDEVRRVYDPEVEALLKRETGASKVVVFDHTIRAADRGVERGHRAPVRSVHNDYTEKSGPQRVRDLLPPDEAEARLKKRFVEINVWRNIAHDPVEMSPLGFVDSESIAPRDLAVCDLVYADRTGEIYHRRLQRRPPLVLLPAHDARRGRADQVLRFDEGRPRPLLAALGVRRSDLAAEPQAAREHRDAHLRLLRLI